MAQNQQFFKRPAVIASAIPQLEQPQAASLATPQVMPMQTTAPALQQVPAATGLPQVNAMPTSTAIDSGLLGLMATPARLLGRAFGSNQTRTIPAGGKLPDGSIARVDTVVPTHHVWDAMTNGSKALERADSINDRNSQQALAEAYNAARVGRATDAQKALIEAQTHSNIQQNDAATKNQQDLAALQQGLNVASVNNRTYAQPPSGVQATPSQLTSTSGTGSEAGAESTIKQGQALVNKQLGVLGNIYDKSSYAQNLAEGVLRDVNPPISNATGDGGSATTIDPSTGKVITNVGRGNPTTSSEERIRNPDIMWGGHDAGGTVKRVESFGGAPNASVEDTKPITLDPAIVAAAAGQGTKPAQPQVNPMPIPQDTINLGGQQNLNLNAPSDLQQQLQNGVSPAPSNGISSLDLWLAAHGYKSLTPAPASVPTPVQ